MQGFVRLLGAVVAVAVLGACSALPPIPVPDLFGLDGASVVLEAGGPSATAVGTSGTTLSWSGDLDATLEAGDVVRLIPAWAASFVSASQLSEAVSLGGSLLVTVPADDEVELQDSIAITAGAITVTVRRANSTLVGSVSGQATFSPPIVFTKVGPCLPAAMAGMVDCDYTAPATTQAVTVSTDQASAAAVFAEILRGDPLRVGGTVTVTLASPGLETTVAVSMTLRSFGGQILF
jgi:hypothetical protein